MNLKLRLRSAILNVVFSKSFLNTRRRLAEIRRKLGSGPHIVSVFVELDDPYSYLLCHYLPEFAAHYDVQLRFYLTEAISGAMRPAPELYPEYAVNDCRRLARERPYRPGRSRKDRRPCTADTRPMVRRPHTNAFNNFRFLLGHQPVVPQ